jgi:hypothetical protein
MAVISHLWPLGTWNIASADWVVLQMQSAHRNVTLSHDKNKSVHFYVDRMLKS